MRIDGCRVQARDRVLSQILAYRCCEVSFPLLMEPLRGQSVELFGRGEILSDSVVHLAFPQHMHQFNAD